MDRMSSVLLGMLNHVYWQSKGQWASLLQVNWWSTECESKEAQSQDSRTSVQFDKGEESFSPSSHFFLLCPFPPSLLPSLIPFFLTWDSSISFSTEKERMNCRSANYFFPIQPPSRSCDWPWLWNLILLMQNHLWVKKSIIWSVQIDQKQVGLGSLLLPSFIKYFLSIYLWSDIFNNALLSNIDKIINKMEITIPVVEDGQLQFWCKKFPCCNLRIFIHLIIKNTCTDIHTQDTQEWSYYLLHFKSHEWQCATHK